MILSKGVEWSLLLIILWIIPDSVSIDWILQFNWILTPRLWLIFVNSSVIFHIPPFTNPQYPLKIDPESISGIVNAVPFSLYDAGLLSITVIPMYTFVFSDVK